MSARGSRRLRWSSALRQGGRRSGPVFYYLIALRKLWRGLLLLLAALLLARWQRAPEILQSVGVFLSAQHLVAADNPLIAALQAGLGAAARHSGGVALATAGYAGLDLAEGVGLLLQRRWAQYLTVVTTASFLPIEVIALAHQFQWGYVLALVLNGLAVAYLVYSRALWPLVRVRSGRRAPARTEPAAVGGPAALDELA